MTTLDLDALETKRKIAELPCPTWSEVSDYVFALRNAAPALIAAYRLIEEWQVEGKKHVARLREIDALIAELTAARARIAQLEAALKEHVKALRSPAAPPVS